MCSQVLRGSLDPVEKVALAFSGGGHRASLFALGVLLYLTEAGKNRDVTSVSSVSGGSLTNGFVAQAGDFSSLTPNEFERRVVRPLAQQLAKRGTLWSSWTTWAYVLALVTGFIATLFVWSLPMHWFARAFLFVVALAGWSFLLASRRGYVCGRTLRTALYSNDGKPTLLSEIQQSNVQHIICATDLHAGEHVYFSGSFVCSYRLGWGRPAHLPLHVAIQASAAYPGGFPPRWLRTARHGFEHGTENVPRYMVLSDGGVYDNMGDQWPIGIRSRKRRWPEHSHELHEPTELVVVNASGPMGWTSVRTLSLPAIGEIFSLLRVIRVLYEKTTTTRRIALVDRFDRAAREGNGLRGALVMINQSPFGVAEYFLAQETEWPDRAVRARTVLDLLGPDSREQWKQIARSNACVKTTLSRLGTDVAASLLYHGYVLAMANLNVILDYPLLAVPSMDRFRDMVS